MQGLSQETPTFRTGVSDVKLDVQVTEGRRLINDLRAPDFLVSDDGQPQTIVYFGRESEPVSLLLLLDVSGSVHPFIDEMAATARQALQLLKSGDRVGIMLFGRRTRLLAPLTDDFGSITTALRTAGHNADVGSGTAINSAIIDAANELAKEAPVQGRQAILILTDNSGLNYQVPDEQVMRALFAGNVVLNALVVGRGDRPAPPKPGRYVNPDFTPSDVFALAEQSGAEAMKVKHAGAVFAEMIERIRTRYTLVYHAPDSPQRGFHRVTVTLSAEAAKLHPHSEIRVRSGYYAEP